MCRDSAVGYQAFPGHLPMCQALSEGQSGHPFLSISKPKPAVRALLSATTFLKPSQICACAHTGNRECWALPTPMEEDLHL